MKRIISLALAALLSAFAFASCGAKDEKTVTVAASSAPHAEILVIVKDILAEKNITLEIKEFTDYVQPNNVVESGEIDANYFQHVPYLDDFNSQNGTHIISASAVHVEPLGIYDGKQVSLDAITAE